MKVVGYRIKAKEFKEGLAVDQDFAAAAEKAFCEELKKEPCLALVHGGHDVAMEVWNSCRQSLEIGAVAVLFFSETIVRLPEAMAKTRFAWALSYSVYKGADPKPFARLVAYVQGLQRLPEVGAVSNLWELIDPRSEIRRQSAVEDLYPIILAGSAGARLLTPGQQAMVKSYRDLLGECDNMDALQQKFKRLIPWQDRRSQLSHNEFGHRFRLILERPSNRQAMTAFLGSTSPLPEHLRILLDRWPRIAADFEDLFETPYDESIEELSEEKCRNIAARMKAARASLLRLSKAVGEIRNFDSHDGRIGDHAQVDELVAECATFASRIEGLRHPMIVQPLGPE